MKNRISSSIILVISALVIVCMLSPSYSYAACTRTVNFNCNRLPPLPPGEDYLCSFAGQNYCCTESVNECVTEFEPGDGEFSSIYGQLVRAIGINTNLTSISGIINAAYSWVFMFAGLILFLMFIYGGFLFLTGSTNAEQIEKGKKLLTSALAGFLIIFMAYWIVQIIEIVFGITILS